MLQGKGRGCEKGAEERQPNAQLHKGHPQSQNPDQSLEADSPPTSEKLHPRGGRGPESPSINCWEGVRIRACYRQGKGLVATPWGRPSESCTEDTGGMS